MLLQILRSLKRFPTKIALVWLQRHMNSDVGGDVISLDRCSTAISPLTSQVQVVGGLAANMLFTNMLLFPISNQSLNEMPDSTASDLRIAFRG